MARNVHLRPVLIVGIVPSHPLSRSVRVYQLVGILRLPIGKRVWIDYASNYLPNRCAINHQTGSIIGYLGMVNTYTAYGVVCTSPLL